MKKKMSKSLLALALTCVLSMGILPGDIAVDAGLAMEVRAESYDLCENLMNNEYIKYDGSERVKFARVEIAVENNSVCATLFFDKFNAEGLSSKFAIWPNGNESVAVGTNEVMFDNGVSTMYTPPLSLDSISDGWVKVYMYVEDSNGTMVAMHEFMFPIAGGNNDTPSSPSIPNEPTPEPDPYWQFGDVVATPGNWKYEAVKFITENGIMKGTAPNEFKPDDSLTRAMFATMLYRMAGEPAVTFTNKFPDVPANKWYSNAVIWASENGIVGGYGDGRFGVSDYITREQIAKMLMQFGNVQGYDVSQRADFASFEDAGKVSGWANDYMKWAVGSGMIGGSKMDGKSYLNPKGNATRAESATMLKRFIEKY